MFDLSKDEKAKGLTLLKPIIVLVSDVPESPMSIRSCAGHIATQVARQFQIHPHRMVYVEYYPAVRYGTQGERVIPERFETVEFFWVEDKAIRPVWRPLGPPLLDIVKALPEKE